MKLALIGGFLGSGKTTAIVKACHQLIGSGEKVAVITNDQGDQQVDTALIRSLGLPSEEVINGCFCCNYAQLDTHIDELSARVRPSIIFAESVGSCTDLAATIAKPMSRLKPDIKSVITIFADAELLLSFVEGRSLFVNESIRYIYQNQLKEAELLVVNKIDLLTSDELLKVKTFVDSQYPEKSIFYHSSWNDRDIATWLRSVDQFTLTKERTSLDIDYDIYANGEAALSWLDRRIVLRSASGNAVFITTKVIGAIFDAIQQRRLPIGHLKFFIKSGTESDKVSFTSSSTSSNVTLEVTESDTLEILINARIEAASADLGQLIARVFQQSQATYGCEILTERSALFTPGYPKPTYRYSNF